MDKIAIGRSTMRKILMLFCCLFVIAVALFSAFKLIKYDDGTIETIKMQIARECVFNERTDIAEKMLAEVENYAKRQDILASMAGAYLKKDRVKSNKIAFELKLRSAKDRYCLYRIEKGVDKDAFSAAFIKNSAMRAYAKYILSVSSEKKSGAIEISEICADLVAESNSSVRSEFALRLMDKAIECDRFYDFISFLPYSIYSIERNALIYKSFRCAESEKGGNSFIKKFNNHISTWLISARKNNEYFLKEKGREAYLNRLRIQTFYFATRREVKNKEIMSYPIGVLYSDSLGRKDDAVELLKLATSTETLSEISNNIDTYAEVSAALLSNAGFSREALDILDCVYIRNLKIDILRKYLPLYSDKGKNLDRILKIIE